MLLVTTIEFEIGGGGWAIGIGGKGGDSAWPFVNEFSWWLVEVSSSSYLGISWISLGSEKDTCISVVVIDTGFKDEFFLVSICTTSSLEWFWWLEFVEGWCDEGVLGVSGVSGVWGVRALNVSLMLEMLESWLLVNRILFWKKRWTSGQLSVQQVSFFLGPLPCPLKWDLQLHLHYPHHFYSRRAKNGHISRGATSQCKFWAWTGRKGWPWHSIWHTCTCWIFESEMKQKMYTFGFCIFPLVWTQRLPKLTSKSFFVPKKIGINDNQMMQVAYMVNPMYLASLKFSGTLRVFIAYQVHKKINAILYPNEIASEKLDVPQVRTATSRLGWKTRTLGGSMASQMETPSSWTEIRPKMGKNQERRFKIAKLSSQLVNRDWWGCDQIQFLRDHQIFPLAFDP